MIFTCRLNSQLNAESGKPRVRLVMEYMDGAQERDNLISQCLGLRANILRKTANVEMPRLTRFLQLNRLRELARFEEMTQEAPIILVAGPAHSTAEFTSR